ncbi:hypothetical protein ACFYWY_26440 [Streptomyces sp. NPDC002870]|uniref:hypothetical protein n=1 Tax=Streptomyces sp. NPDC002870 TaxID=3364666 RepID=UPI003699F6AC
MGRDRDQWRRRPRPLPVDTKIIFVGTDILRTNTARSSSTGSTPNTIALLGRLGVGAK